MNLRSTVDEASNFPMQTPNKPSQPPSPANPASPIPAKTWQNGIGPAFLALGMSVVFLDRLAPTTLMIGGLAPSMVGAFLAAVLAYWCLYYAPAMWGFRAHQPLSVIAARTFGERGSLLLPVLLLIAIHVVWFAVTIEYAVQYGLSGLAACGLLDPKYLEMNHRGTWTIPKPLFLAVAGCWSITSAIIGTLAVRLVSAIMSAYIVFPAIVIGAATVWAMPFLSSGPIEPMPFSEGGGRALSSMIQLVFAFLAAQVLGLIDWGTVTRSERDVRNGGIAGVMIAIPVLSVLSLLIVAGYVGVSRQEISSRNERPSSSVSQAPAVGKTFEIPTNRMGPPARSATLREAFLYGIGGWLGGTGLLILALALLGPACTNPYEISRYSSLINAKIPRWASALLGALATWPLIASGWTKNLEGVFGVLGALSAPVVGTLVADFVRSGGEWSGPSRKVKLASFLSSGLGSGAAILILMKGERYEVSRYLPSSVVGFVAAFAIHVILSLTKLEAKPISRSHEDECQGS